MDKILFFVLCLFISGVILVVGSGDGQHSQTLSLTGIGFMVIALVIIPTIVALYSLVNKEIDTSQSGVFYKLGLGMIIIIPIILTTPTQGLEDGLGVILNASIVSVISIILLLSGMFRQK
jgi:drug/metabolite transporter (DMT)-like permease